jgi:hypothetical protein
MWKKNNWLIGLVILSTVIALIFGATYFFAQSELAQSVGPGGPGSELGTRPLPAAASSDSAEAGAFPVGAPPEGGHGFQLGAAVGNVVLSLVKIAFITWVVVFAIPRLWSLIRRRSYGRSPVPMV